MQLIRDLLNISEATAYGSKPARAEELQIEQAIDILKKHCKHTMWMVKEVRPFYRGDRGLLGGADTGIVDTRKTTRKSQNTANYYTVIFDNTPSTRGFPKRSKSLICTTSRETASLYSGVVTCLIPFDDAKIGLVHRDDMWDTLISFIPSFLTRKINIDSMNQFFARSDIDDSWEDIVRFAEKLKSGDEEAIKSLRFAVTRFTSYGLSTPEKVQEVVDYLKDHFLQAINNAYSPESTGHEAFTGATLPHDFYKEKSEAWIEGDIVVITAHTLSRIKAGMFPEED